MFDRSIPMIPLTMQADDITEIQEYKLPDEYAWRFFVAGDEHEWARMQMSFDGFPCAEDALKCFRTFFPTNEDLDRRMLYLTDNGVPFGTATAWHDGIPGSRRGRLHWFCIDAAYQGKGLSYPLLYLALCRMRELGCKSAYLTTQTSSWVAIKTYHRFGFRPLITSPEEIEGWKMVSDLTGIDFMKQIKA